MRETQSHIKSKQNANMFMSWRKELVIRGLVLDVLRTKEKESSESAQKLEDPNGKKGECRERYMLLTASSEKQLERKHEKIGVGQWHRRKEKLRRDVSWGRGEPGSQGIQKRL